MCSGSEAGSYSRLIDLCITQLKAEGPSRTCNESKEEEEEAFKVTVSVNGYVIGSKKRCVLGKLISSVLQSGSYTI